MKRLMLLWIVLLAIGGCGVAERSPGEIPSPQPEAAEYSQEAEGADDLSSPAPAAENTGKEPAAPETRFLRARLMAVGDIMMHIPQTRSGYDAATGTYNFDAFFTEVAPVLSEADWVFGNLETPLAGEDAGGYSGYPMFNAPPELADALKNAGFQVLSTANNHSLDRREKGVLRTLEHLRSHGLVPVGTAASAEEAEKIAIETRNGIALAFLAYTYGTNGIPVPEDKPYLVSLIEENRMTEQIRKARELGADAVAVSMHFGVEYQPKPNAEQKRLSELLVAAGADIVLGSHPHVLQPYEWIETLDAGGNLRKGVVIYSMGNFISNQDRSRNANKPTEVGVIFEVGIGKRLPDGEVVLTGARAIPTYVHKYYDDGGKLKYRVLPLEKTLAERSDALLKDSDYERLESYYREAVLTLENAAAPASAP